MAAIYCMIHNSSTSVNLNTVFEKTRTRRKKNSEILLPGTVPGYDISTVSLLSRDLLFAIFAIIITVLWYHQW